MKNGLFWSTEVAGMFGVSRKTIARWAEQGLLPCTRTAGGHLRFTEEQIASIWDLSRITRGSESRKSLIP